MHPWPTAYTFWHSANLPALRLIVHRVCPVELGGTGFQPVQQDVEVHRLEAGATQLPGALLPIAANPPRLLVATGAGGVEILELQPAGKRRMKAEEFLRGRPVRPGDRMEAS
jgi:methionyl-tRNA formyltransferase